MGKDWDNESVAFSVDYWKDVLRVLKPGAHGVVAGGTRTHHRLGAALEDAGFEIRDSILWIHGQGFPKSLDVSKAIDKAAGAEREVVGTSPRHAGRAYSESKGWNANGLADADVPLTAPATAAARQWSGWGTALKPATEVWWLVRKPLDSPNVASNVLKHGTGALNVDGCRVAGTGAEEGRVRHGGGTNGTYAQDEWTKANQATMGAPMAAGRWPANLVLSHSEGCRPLGVRKVRGGGSGQRPTHRDSASTAGGNRSAAYGAESRLEGHVGLTHRDPDGTETVAAWDCAEDCPVAELDRQSGESQSPATYQRASDSGNRNAYAPGVGEPAGKTSVNFGDSGGASRFFPTFRYEPKASTTERNQGLSQSYLNKHPTVKSVELMRWLCRLITPPQVYECVNCRGVTDQTVQGVREDVSASTEGAVHLLDQLPPTDRGAGRSGEQSTDSVQALRPDVQAEGRPGSLLLDQVSSAGSANATAPMPDLRDSVPSEDGSEVLFPEVREPGSSDETASELRGVPEGIHAQRTGQSVLFPSLFSESGGKAEAQGAAPGAERLHADLGSRQSDGESRRVRDGASVGNGGAPGPASDFRRSGASRQRDQGRQPNRESGTDVQEHSRPDPEAATATDSVPALRGPDRSIGSCPACGGPLTKHPGVVLDPFCGSGSTGVAAKLEGFRFIGIEKDAESYQTARRRLEWAVHEPGLFDEEVTR